MKMRVCFTILATSLSNIRCFWSDTGFQRLFTSPPVLPKASPQNHRKHINKTNWQVPRGFLGHKPLHHGPAQTGNSKGGRVGFLKHRITLTMSLCWPQDFSLGYESSSTGIRGKHSNDTGFQRLFISPPVIPKASPLNHRKHINETDS